MFVMQTIFSLAGFLVAGALLDWQGVYTAFGLHEPVFYAGLLLLGIIFEPLLFFLNPVFSRQSRKKEFTADNFARKIMGTAEPLKNSLINLSIHNLGEIHPHPLYVSFYYSHPPILQRLKALNE
jgi:STE24 endopeptidase